MQDKAPRATKAAFNWEDPFLLEAQLTDDRRPRDVDEVVQLLGLRVALGAQQKRARNP